MSDLPPGWVEVPLGDVCGIVSGSTPKSTEPAYWGGDIPWITPDDLSRHVGKHIAVGRRSITEAGFASCSARMVPTGTVLYTSRAPIGYVAVARQPVCTNQGFKNIVPPPGLSSDYLYWYMHHATAEVKARASGTTFAEISGKAIKAVPLRIAPTAEQERIVAAIEEQFSRLDAGVATLERVRQELERLRAAVLQKLVGYGSSEQLPDGWRWATIADVAGHEKSPVLTGPFGTTLGRVDFVRDGVPVLTIGCLTPEGISLSKAPRVSVEKAASLTRYALEEGDVLFSRMATVGRAAVVGSREAGSLINYHLMRLRLDQAVLGSDYLALLCRGSRAVQDYLTASNHGVTRPGINTKQLMNLPVALPTRPQQIAIVDQVKSVDDLCSELDRKVMQARSRADKLRLSVLVAAFVGHLVPQDSSDEPASVLLDRIASESAPSDNRKPRTRQGRRKATA